MHQKRRASPTELRPELPTMAEKVPAGNTGLAKRASFKKMRGSSESVPIYSPTPSQSSVSGSLGSMLSASGNTRSPGGRSYRGTTVSAAGSSASSNSSGGSGGSGSGVGRMRNRLRATLEMQEREEEEDRANEQKKR